MFRRIRTLFIARNKEFYRDKSNFFWNLLFPFLIIFAFSFIFDESKQVLYKAGIVKYSQEIFSNNKEFQRFKNTKFIEFVEFSEFEKGLDKLKHHRIDILLKPDTNEYWVSSSSPKGYVLEKILHSNTSANNIQFKKKSITGIKIPYIEWLFPGVLGMNLMFSSLFGVGFVVVRYRKNGVLKRFSVTPVRAFEFLTAQVISRMFVLLVTTSIVYTGCSIFYDFNCRGSIFSLFLVFTVGGFCMVSLGLLIASRSSSEEFAGGILNLITWPMMFFSGVWFSLEGSNEYIQSVSKIFPLTHLVESAREIMNDGAGLYEIRYKIGLLLIMSVIFIISGSLLFKWQKA